MIYTDDKGIVNIEYGHGSIMGFQCEYPDEIAVAYSLSSTDKHDIGCLCENFDELKEKFDDEIGVSARIRFTKIESMDIVIKDLIELREKLKNKLRKPQKTAP